MLSNQNYTRLPSVCPYIIQHVQDAAVPGSVHSLIGGDKHSQGSWTPQRRGQSAVLENIKSD